MMTMNESIRYYSYFIFLIWKFDWNGRKGTKAQNDRPHSWVFLAFQNYMTTDSVALLVMMLDAAGGVVSYCCLCFLCVFRTILNNPQKW